MPPYTQRAVDWPGRTTCTRDSVVFSLNPGSSVPIYRQIVDQTRLLVASNRLSPGEQLPSVRAIASELGVNPMTVSKAYSLLEQGGILERRRGIGMVVSESGLDAGEAMATDTSALVRTARQLGLSRAEFIAHVNKFWEES